MSLLDDLKAVDVSGIVSARGSLTASINAPELKALLHFNPGTMMQRLLLLIDVSQERPISVAFWQNSGCQEGSAAA